MDRIHIQVADPLISEAVQRLGFKYGYSWLLHGQVVMHTEQPVLVFSRANTEITYCKTTETPVGSEKEVNIPELIEFIGRQIIKVGEHEVKFYEDGSIRVGCTALTAKEVDTIIEARNHNMKS